MGLDIVEMIMDFEDQFDIEFEESEANQFTTPRNVIELISKKVEFQPNENTCLTGRAFRLLRKVFINKFSLSKQQFRRNTPLESIVPKKHRKKLWRELGLELQARNWPDLARPVLLQSFIALGWLFTIHVLYSYLQFSFFFSFIGGLGILFLALVLTRSFKESITYTQVEDLVYFLVARNSKLLKKNESGWSREQIACVVREIVIEKIGIKDYHEDARFIEDMGMD